MIKLVLALSAFERFILCRSLAQLDQIIECDKALDCSRPKVIHSLWRKLREFN